mmetsp:Transcript_126978/g.220115  ORF Transcript_126978/g.220115 Transcript_126978/m.220115 type:complete len:258 (+) Transcript_126978:1-774(+)
MGGKDSKIENEAKMMCKAALRDADNAKDYEDYVIQSFQEWDLDANGFISDEELADVFTEMGLKMSQRQVQELLKDMDNDRDGHISYPEMVAYLFRAPYLEEYIEHSKFIYKTALVSGDANFNVPLEYKHKNRDLIRKAFAWHDKDGSGTLEKDESIIFFSNYASLLPELHMYAIAEIASEKKQARAQAKFDAWLASCKDRHKFDERIQAAFKLIDVKGDGRLSERHVISYLGFHGSERNLKLLDALELPRCFDWDDL